MRHQCIKRLHTGRLLLLQLLPSEAAPATGTVPELLMRLCVCGKRFKSRRPVIDLREEQVAAHGKGFAAANLRITL